MNVRWDKLEDSQIWIGFTDRPDSVSNGKFLVIQATEQPSSILSVFRIKEMEGGLPLPVFDKVSVPFDSGSYFIEMQIDMNRLSIWLNNSSARNFPIFEVEGRYLFIGYLSQTVGVDIDARISNIQILP